MCGLASATAPTGTMFSSTPAPCCWFLSWPSSPLMFRDVRHVGQEVSCSSHERRQELKTQTCSSIYCIEMYWSLFGVFIIAAETPNSLTRTHQAFCKQPSLKLFQEIKSLNYSNFHLEELINIFIFCFTCGRDDHREVYVLSTSNPNRWRSHHHWRPALQP